MLFLMSGSIWGQANRIGLGSTVKPVGVWDLPPHSGIHRLDCRNRLLARANESCCYDSAYVESESSLGGFDRFEILAGLDVLKFLHDA